MLHNITALATNGYWLRGVSRVRYCDAVCMMASFWGGAFSHFIPSFLAFWRRQTSLWSGGAKSLWFGGTKSLWSGESNVCDLGEAKSLWFGGTKSLWSGESTVNVCDLGEAKSLLFGAKGLWFEGEAKSLRFEEVHTIFWGKLHYALWGRMLGTSVLT